jgi:hypothetical protein
MPYKIEKRKGKFHLINKETGEDKGASDTYEKAVAHMRLMYGVEHGMKPRKK